jgi:hypothetical protein
MKRKVGTLIEERLLRGARRVALSKQVPLHQVFEDALESYLEQEDADELLSLEELLRMKPGSSSSAQTGIGAGDFHDEDID